MGNVCPDIMMDGGGTRLSYTSFNFFLVDGYIRVRRNGWKPTERIAYESLFTRTVMPLGPIKSGTRSEAEWR